MQSLPIIIPLGIAIGVVFFVVGYLVRRFQAETSIRRAEEQSKRIVREANKEAEALKKEAILEAKEHLYQAKAEFEKQTKEQRQELQQLERRLTQREENLEKKVNLLDQREHSLNKRRKELDGQEHKLAEKETELTALIQQQQSQLERISGLSSEQAKQMLIGQMEEEAKRDAGLVVRQILDKAQRDAEMEAKNLISAAVQRCSSEYVAEGTVSVVDLPNDEMKGRIIGREGRNIRALESATGIDLIIDDTPEAVILSGFDPIRREVAAQTLKKLVADGRIHPARIEEIVKKVSKEMDVAIHEIGKQTAFDVGIHGLHDDLHILLGRLRYRTSYAQNVLKHSKEVAYLAAMMADELQVNSVVAKRAGLLHDIGKAVDHEVEGSHARIGADLAKKYRENPDVVHAIAAHHNDEEPHSIEAILIQSADALSAARPGARREILETYIKRLEKLEALANSFKGVDKSYAIQAGREIRIIVEPNEINDDTMSMLAMDIAKKIEGELEYPGEIKVTVIRETRTVTYAR